MKTFTTYPNIVLTAMMETGLQHYTSDIDYIVAKYNDVWMPYKKLQALKAFSHLPSQESLEGMVA